MERITRFRSFLLLLIFGLLLGFYSVKMYSLQVLGTGTVVDNASTYTSDIRVRAARGDILDNNGNKLIGNRASYNMVFNNYVLMSSDTPNESLQKLVSLCRELDIEYVDNFPVTMERPYEYTLDQFDSTWQGYFQAYLTELDIDSDISANRLMRDLRDDYGIPDDWSDSDVRRVIGLRYELKLRTGLTNLPSYEFIVDVKNEDMTAILELNTPGLTAEVSTIREYYTDNAAHILGSVGKMTAEEWVKYKELGYSMDAYVGKSGLEAAFEEELHGVDGLLRRTVDKNGNIISEYWVKEPQVGNNVEISLDIDMQVAAEYALEAFVLCLRNGNGLDGEGVGADIEGGAAVAIEVKTGKILACATYPSYTLTQYREDYKGLEKAEYDPLFNRALQAAYPPGSTFKVAMSIAGLESGKIDRYTQIRDDGVFTKYAGSSPKCLVYSRTGGTHGYLDVAGALRVSCNYFYYVLGDWMDWDDVDPVVKSLGLGEHTGIELGESIGQRANEETKKKNYSGSDAHWYAMDQVLASIGQSDHRYTPMQLCSYVSAVANKGTRYAATFMKRVVSADYATLVEENTREVLSVTKMSNDTVEAVFDGMRQVVTSGSAASAFKGFDVEVCGKTGTAEHETGGSSNGAFICFAPMDKPEIAVAVYGEKAGSGSYMGRVARAVLEYYFSAEELSDSVTYENKVG